MSDREPAFAGLTGYPDDEVDDAVDDVRDAGMRLWTIANDRLIRTAFDFQWAGQYTAALSTGLRVLSNKLTVVAGVHTLATSDEPVELTKAALSTLSGAAGLSSRLASAAGAASAAGTMGAIASAAGWVGAAVEVMTGGGRDILRGKEIARANGATQGYAFGLAGSVLGWTEYEVLRLPGLIDEFSQGGEQAHDEGVVAGVRAGFDAGAHLDDAERHAFQRMMWSHAGGRVPPFSSMNAEGSAEWHRSWLLWNAQLLGSMIQDPPDPPAPTPEEISVNSGGDESADVDFWNFVGETAAILLRHVDDLQHTSGESIDDEPESPSVGDDDVESSVEPPSESAPPDALGAMARLVAVVGDSVVAAVSQLADVARDTDAEDVDDEPDDDLPMLDDEKTTSDEGNNEPDLEFPDHVAGQGHELPLPDDEVDVDVDVEEDTGDDVESDVDVDVNPNSIGGIGP